MRKIVFIALCMLLIFIFTVPGCNLFQNVGNKEGIVLHETPQKYVLSDKNSNNMPRITLYENGNARLSQPPYSSFAIVGTGRFEVKGDELTISHGENISATFTISDGGDTLTLKSASLLFTKAGDVYKYRSNENYLNNYDKVDGEKLTIELLRDLAKKAQALTIEDFEKYAHVDIDPDYHIFDIEGRYTLSVVFDADRITSCTVERNSSGETFPLILNGSTGYVFDEFLGAK